MYGQLKNPMTKIRTAIRSEFPDRPNALLGMTPARASANTSSGKARNTSMARAMSESTQPPR